MRASQRRHMFQFHPALHREWGQTEHLVFWRLGFYPTYQRTAILQAISELCKRHRVESCVVYEVLGQHDLLLRCYLPWTREEAIPQKDAAEGSRWELLRQNMLAVDGDLRRTLSLHHLFVCESFLVTRIHRHWVFDGDAVPDLNGKAPPLAARTGADANRYPDLRELNRLVRAYNPTLVPGVGEVGDPPIIAEAEAFEGFSSVQVSLDSAENDGMSVISGAELIEAGWLRHAELGLGTKFAMFVSTAPEISPQFVNLRDLTKALTRIVDEAASDTPPGIVERSLYEGIGFARYLIMGKVPEGQFEPLTERLINPIVDNPTLTQAYGTHTFTYISTSRDLSELKEGLALPPEPSRPSFRVPRPIGALLGQHGDGRRGEGGERVNAEENANAVTQLLTDLVALLNNARGGAIEFDDAGRPLRRTLVPITDETHPIATAWLRNAVGARIDPDPFTIKTVRLMGEPTEADGTTVPDSADAVRRIEVHPGAGRWYYLKDDSDAAEATFIVETEPGCAEPLWGTDADEFKANQVREWFPR